MRLKLVVALAVALHAAPALPHTLNHYAQATTVAVGREGIGLELHLTVGHDVAETVLGAIDTDGDGVLSEGEQSGYTERVLADLALALDGVPQPLALASAVFPEIAAMRAGTGSIVLVMDVPGPMSDGAHELTFENSHRGDIAVYLVNALVPDDPGIAIVSQQRSADQAFYTLVFSIAPDS